MEGWTALLVSEWQNCTLFQVSGASALWLRCCSPSQSALLICAAVLLKRHDRYEHCRVVAVSGSLHYVPAELLSVSPYLSWPYRSAPGVFDSPSATSIFPLSHTGSLCINLKNIEPSHSLTLLCFLNVSNSAIELPIAWLMAERTRIQRHNWRN